jgi:hypothetical protein
MLSSSNLEALMTPVCRNELYAKLVRMGTDAGYAVIPEFKVRCRGRRWKSIDLVWAKMRPKPLAGQRCESLGLWQLFATFEIEGCDVPYSRIERHVKDLSAIRTSRGATKKPHHVVLYSKAYDRNWDPGLNVDEAIKRRQQLATNPAVSVIDGSSLSLLLP